MTALSPTADRVPRSVGRPRMRGMRRACRSWRTRTGIVLTGLVALIAVVGPFVAPHDPGDLVGFPLSQPSSSAPFGTDYIGHDVFSRVLEGGFSVLWMALAATVIGMAIGIGLGLAAGYARPAVDSALMTALDIILAFPQFVLPIMFVAMLGPKLWLVVLLVALSHAPRVARLTRAMTQDITAREYIEACEVLAMPRWRILFGEVLPNLTTPLMVEFGIRMAWSIGIVASISFLGLGVQSPNADWGLMIEENRDGLATQPWTVIPAVVLISLFTIGVNLITEGYSRAVAGVGSRGQS